MWGLFCSPIFPDCRGLTAEFLAVVRNCLLTGSESASSPLFCCSNWAKPDYSVMRTARAWCNWANSDSSKLKSVRAWCNWANSDSSKLKSVRAWCNWANSDSGKLKSVRAWCNWANSDSGKLKSVRAYCNRAKTYYSALTPLQAGAGSRGIRQYPGLAARRPINGIYSQYRNYQLFECSFTFYNKGRASDLQNQLMEENEIESNIRFYRRVKH